MQRTDASSCHGDAFVRGDENSMKCHVTPSQGERRPLPRLSTLIALSGVLLAACSTPDPSGAKPKPQTPGQGGSDAGTVWDGSFEDAGEEPEDLCGEPPVSTESFTRAALLGAAAECAAWHACRFEAAAKALDDKVRALADEPGDEALDEARLAWRNAMLVWSENELLQFGPVAPVTMDLYHGKGIRNLIYAWPRMSRRQVEEQVATQRFANEGMGKVLINGRGLFATEYLLFYTGNDHDLAPGSTSATTWESLDADELAKRKRAYAQAVSGDILERAREITTVWSPEGGNFKQTLVSATGYGNEQEALNVVAWALVYVEREIKDWKLGVPAGYSATAPVDGPETPFAGIAIENIRRNLRGFRSLFQGCGPNGEGIGFDDWLNAVGHSQLGDDISAAWQNAQDAADAFPPLHTASQEQVDGLYKAVKGLTDLLKAEFFGPGSPLNLKLPATVEGDTD